MPVPLTSKTRSLPIFTISSLALPKIQRLIPGRPRVAMTSTSAPILPATLMIVSAELPFVRNELVLKICLRQSEVIPPQSWSYGSAVSHIFVKFSPEVITVIGYPGMDKLMQNNIVYQVFRQQYQLHIQADIVISGAAAPSRFLVP